MTHEVEDWWKNSPALAMLAAERVVDFLEQQYNNSDIEAGMSIILSNEEDAFQFKVALAKVIADNSDLAIFPNKG